MTCDMKLVTPSDAVAHAFHLVGVELYDPTTAATYHVIVWCLAEGVFEIRLLHVKPSLTQYATIHEQWKRAIDRGFADAKPAFLQGVHDLLRLEVVCEGQHGVENVAPRQRVLDTMIAQVLNKRLANLLGFMYMGKVSGQAGT